jgi:malate dehydrogenase (oxaloacetate-decarboxylating)
LSFDLFLVALFNMTFDEEVQALHKNARGKIATVTKVPLNDREDLAKAYTPGVAGISSAIAADPSLLQTYTNVGNTVAIVTDGSAVLGLGNIGPKAAMPVMEGKAALFKRFADIDAVPICLDTQDLEKIIAAVTAIAPSFAGINLEDIAAPRCFAIEAALQEKLSIPVFHDDQHGTAIVVLAGLTNALLVRKLQKSDARIVISGAGAAGTAILELLWEAGFHNITLCDRKGVLYPDREDLDGHKKIIALQTKPTTHTLEEALEGAHIFIGVSGAGILTKEFVSRMAEQSIIFALANPTPEIYPDEAKAGGAYIVATGRSDYPNQINNALAFPGLFRGALDSKAPRITTAHMLAAAEAIANLVPEPNPDHIIPDIFDPKLVPAVARVF